jgi:hypothetical protein
MSEPKFKVGDKVKFKPEHVGYTDMQDLPLEGTITGSDDGKMSENTIVYLDGGEHGNGAYLFRLELATEPLAASTIRKNRPLARGCLDYFPAALAAVSELSRIGNEKHNPGEDMHHARGKSSDHADCILRHLVDRGTVDPETGLSHSVAVAWRALALLQEELEAAGAPVARGARGTK